MATDAANVGEVDGSNGDIIWGGVGVYVPNDTGATGGVNVGEKTMSSPTRGTEE